MSRFGEWMARRLIQRMTDTYMARVDELAREVESKDKETRARAAPRIKDTALGAVDAVWNDSVFSDPPAMYFHGKMINDFVDDLDARFFTPYLLQRLRIGLDDFLLAAAEQHGTPEEREAVRHKLASKGLLQEHNKGSKVPSALPEWYASRTGFMRKRLRAVQERITSTKRGKPF